MRLIPSLAFLLASACASVQRSQPAAPEPADLALTRVNVVDVESGRVLPEQTVLIAGNRIQAVGPSARTRIPSGTQVVDGSGQYLIPGLIDTHVHANLNKVDPVPLPMFPWFLANGVTTVRDASGAGREKTFVEVRERAERGEILFPRFYVSGTARAEHRAARGRRHARPDAVADRDGGGRDQDHPHYP